MASLLLSRYDVFLLDEPTNDLDLDGLARLEAFVTGLRAATVLVSHDREFLARTVTAVVELDLAQHQVNTYGGGYESYLAEREVARRHARERYEEFADTKAVAGAAGTDAARVDGQGCAQRAPQGPRQRQDRPQQTGRVHREAGGEGTADRPADRAAGRGRGAAQGVGAADGDRRRAPGRRGGRGAAWRGGAARVVHPRPGRPADRLGGQGRHHRRERRRQVDAARRAARPGRAGGGHVVARARGAGRRGRPGPRVVHRRARRCSPRSRRSCPTCRRPSCARCSRSSA